MTFKVSTIFRAVDQMSAPVRKMRGQLESMTRAGVKGMRRLQSRARKATQAVKAIGVQTVAAGAAAATGFFTAIKAGIEFEKTIVSATARMPGQVRRGTDAFNEVSAAAAKIGANTEFSATQAAGAVNFLAKAGFNAKKSIAALPGLTDFATVSELGLARAADIATDALGAFKLTVDDPVQLAANLQRVSDVLATTANTTNAAVGELFESIRKGGPPATAVGQSIETVSAMLLAMAAAGTKAEIAGTAIQNFFLRLSAPASEARKVLRRLHVDVVDGSGNMRDAFDIVQDLSKALAGLGNQQQLQIISKIFGAEGLAGNLQVVQKGADGLREYRKRLEGSTGAAAKMATVMRDTTANSIQNLMSVVESVSILLFELTRGPFRDLIDRTTAWVRANRELVATRISEFFKTVADRIDGVVTAIKWIGGTLAVLAALSAAINIVTAAVVAFNFVVALNPITIMVGAAVIAVAALAAAIYTHWEPIKTFVSGLWDSIKGFFDNITSAAKTFGRLFTLGSFPMLNVQGAAGAGANVPRFDAPDASPGRLTPLRRPPDMSSPVERQQSLLTETIEKSVTEIIIKDPGERAEVKNKKGGANNLRIERTGEF